jgi:hypothetical protein
MSGDAGGRQRRSADGYLMYRSGLVPRGMAMLGLIGGPLIVLSGIGVLFDLYDAGGPVQGIATIPE